MRILNSLGFSLPELLVAMGLLGGIYIVTMKMMEEQASNESNVKANAEISRTVSLIQSVLNNTENCKSMLFNRVVGSKIDNLQYTKDGKLHRLLQDGDSIDRNYGLFKLKDNDIRLEISTLGTGIPVADLVINFRVKKKSLLAFAGDIDANYTIYQKRIPIIVVLNSANQIISCGPVVSDSNVSAKEKFCQSLGGAAQWVGNRCILRSMDCPWGEVPKELTSLGGVICVPIETVIDLNTIFDVTPGCSVSTGRYSIEAVGNPPKLRLRCP